MLEDTAKEYPYWRILETGFFLACYRTAFGNGRLVFADVTGPIGNWCYPSLPEAVVAMTEWKDPGMGIEHRPPDGWFREIHTGIRRIDGEPDKEYYQP